MKILFLDDEEMRHRLVRRHTMRFTHVHTAQQAIEAMQAQRFDVVFLDHDLAPSHYVSLQQAQAGVWGSELGGQPTGYEVVRWMVKQDPATVPAHTIIHSMNPAGADRMVSALHQAGLTAERRVFGSDSFMVALKGLARDLA
jgi:hypothetical protein